MFREKKSRKEDYQYRYQWNLYPPVLWVGCQVFLDLDIEGVDLLNVHLVQRLDVEDAVQYTVVGETAGLCNTQRQGTNTGVV